MRQRWPITVILLGTLSGCPHGTSVRVPESDPAGGLPRGATGRPDAPLHEIHQVYRIARQVRAQKVGQPDEVVVSSTLRAGTVLLQRTRWELLYMGQSAVAGLGLRSRYMRLPEAERRKHMQRHDDFVQVWWVRRADLTAKPETLKGRLKPTRRPHPQQREVAYLGRDSRFAWYLYAPIHDWVRVQKELSLGGGDDATAALIRGLGVKDRHDGTAVGCFYLLSDLGAKAISSLEVAIADKSPHRGQAIRAVGRDRGKVVTSWLMRLVGAADPVVSRAARSSLLYPPRKAAESLYVKWLDAGAGKRWVGRELSACAEIKAQGAARIIPRILANPHRASEYRQAFMLQQRVIRAGFAMGSRQPDRAALAAGVKALLGSPDTESAAIIALTLALFVSKGNYEATNKAGVEILRKLAGDQGLMLVIHLSKALRDLGDQNAVGRIATALRSN
jgi:hypothetical protein